MCPKDDSHLTIEFNDHYVICPSISFYDEDNDYKKNALGETGKAVELGFEYNSGTNQEFLSVDGLQAFNERAQLEM